MKRLAYIILAAAVFSSCGDDHEVLVPKPDLVDLNEITLERYTHVIPDGGFSSRGVNFNTARGSDGTFGGFGYSSRSYRSFTWSGKESALDSTRFSVMTPAPNQTGVYAVACVRGDDAYFTLDTPAVVEYALVANTTYAYLAMYYGEKTNSIANPNIPSAPTGVWYSYAPGVTRTLAQTGDYFRVVATGYLGGRQTGTASHFLCCRRNADPDNPGVSFLRNDWVRFDMDGLGTVDKVVFHVECSVTDAQGASVYPAWFCLDGIKLGK